MENFKHKSRGVGYKRPPAHSRFTKGKSGNPKGRPKGSEAGSELARIIDQPVTVTLDGRPRQVSLSEATVISLAQQALTGNTSAVRELIKIAQQVEAEEKAREEASMGPIVFRITSPELKDCNAALEKLGVIEPYGDSWRICTWVVEVAWARNNQLLSDKDDRQLVTENMVDEDALRLILARAA